MAEGACNCGAVRFEITSDFKGVFVCHCSICRRATGSNGIAVLVVDNDDLSWEAGEEFISTWKKPGADWQTWFCRQCGSPLPGINSEKTMFVPAGLLTDGELGLTVRDHIFVDSKAEWDEIGDSGRQHAGAYEPPPSAK